MKNKLRRNSEAGSSVKKYAYIFEENDIKLSDDQYKKFSIYLRLLKKWNRVHNLTSLESEEEIVKRHFLDSLSLARCFEDIGLDPAGKSIADVGSGAGFPGVPLKIYYGDKIKLYLIESSSKKCSFLEYLKVNIGEDFEVICERAEGINLKTDIGVARALGDLSYTEKVLESIAREYIFIMKGSKVEKSALNSFNAYRLNMKYLPKLYILWKRIKGQQDPRELKT